MKEEDFWLLFFINKNSFWTKLGKLRELNPFSPEIVGSLGCTLTMVTWILQHLRNLCTITINIRLNTSLVSYSSVLLYSGVKVSK